MREQQHSYPHPYYPKQGIVSKKSRFEWRLKNWGTKWDIRHESFNDCEKTEFTPTEKDSVQVKFHTAWHPPMLALKTLSEKFKDLKFKLYYIDEMFNFQGDAEIENGDIPLWSQKDELLA